MWGKNGIDVDLMFKHLRLKSLVLLPILNDQQTNNSMCHRIRGLKHHVLPLNNKPFLLGFPDSGPVDTSHQAGAPFSPKEIQVDKTYDVIEEI